MSHDELVVIATFLNRIEAEIAQSALEAGGIASTISADDTGGLRPHLSLLGVRLLVRASDREQAQTILDLNLQAVELPDEG